MAGGDDDHTGDDDILPSWNIVVICTVGGVLMLEFLTHQMNAAAKGKKHAMELLEGLYRELAILGVVAFVLWSINVSEAVTIEYNDKHLFEQIHMTLFLAALFHSFPIGMVVLYSRQTIRRWDMFEDDEMRRYKDLKQQYRRTAAQLGIRHSQLKRGVGIFKWACLWTSHPILCRRLSELSEHVSYHALRSQFIKVNQLPKNFRFAAYLKKCEQEVVIGLAEIKHGVWVGLILFVAVELYVKGIMGKANSNADGRGLFLLAAALVISAALAVHFKLKHIYSTLVHTYRPSTERRDDLAQYLGPETSAQIPVRQIQQDMFWFGKPHLLLTALQTMQFVLAVMVSALIWFGAGESEGLLIVAEMLLAVGAFAIYIVVLPKFIPRFTQVTHIGGMVNRNILSETLLKQKKAFQRRTLPPTLRQVSVMARLKSNEALEYGLLFMGARKIMSAQGFREGVKVMVGVHFAIVAYNTNPVEQDSGDGLAWVAELVLSGIALLVEISTHFVVWRGMAFFHCNPFVEVPNRVANAPHKPAAAVYPSSSRRQLLDDDADASGGHDQEFGRSSAAVSTRKETHMVCSIRACFGWSGGEYPTAGGGGCCPCLDGTPPESVVGAWRSLDLALILVVLGCAIATGLVEGVTRVVVHAIQGVVVLRLWPLSRCPFPPAVGFDTIRNVNGATVNHAPLDKNALEAVMQETLTLLRRQNPQEGTFEDRALAVETTNNGMIDENRLRDNGNPSTHKLNGSTNGKQETLTEEKDEDKDSEQDNDDGLAEDGIANVGVAMALRQACAAHPDLVQSHGPLSIPIMRAMLGLDPHKAKGQDDAKAFAIASRAVTLARSLSHLEENPSFIPYDEDRRAVFRRRRSSSGELPLAPEPSSPSSSDLSDGDTNDGAAERGVLGISQHGGGKRGRISSFLSGGGGRYRKNHSQHRHHHHQHQEPDQQQQHEQQQQQQGVYQQQQQQLLHQQQKQVQMMQQEHLKQLQYQRYQLGHHHNVSINQDPGTAYHHDPEQAHVGMLRSEHRGEFMTSRAMTGAAHPQIGTVPMGELGDAVIHTPFNPFNSAVAAGGGIVSSTRRSASTRGVNSTLNSHSRHQRRILHRNTSWDQTGGTVAAAFEDLERAVLPSLGSSAGSQYGGSNGGGRGGRGGVGGTGTGKGVSLAGGGRVPYSSGRSVPYSSGHHHAWRGTPAKALKGSASASANEQHPPAAASDDNKRNTAPPPRSNELTERKEIDGGGGRGRMGGSSGGGGGGVDDVDGGAGGAIGVGGIDGGAGVGDDGGGHDAFLGGGNFVSSVAHNGGGDGSLRHCGGGCVARYVADDGGDGRGGGGSYGSSNIGGDVEELREVRTSDATESGSGASATAENSTTPSTYLASMDAFQPKGNNAE